MPGRRPLVQCAPLSVEVAKPIAQAPPSKIRPTWKVATIVEPFEKVSGSTSVWWLVVLDAAQVAWVNESVLIVVGAAAATAGARARISVRTAMLASPARRAREKAETTTTLLRLNGRSDDRSRPAHLVRPPGRVAPGILPDRPSPVEALRRPAAEHQDRPSDPRLGGYRVVDATGVEHAHGGRRERRNGHRPGHRGRVLARELVAVGADDQRGARRVHPRQQVARARDDAGRIGAGLPEDDGRRPHRRRRPARYCRAVRSGCGKAGRH